MIFELIFVSGINIESGLQWTHDAKSVPAKIKYLNRGVSIDKKDISEMSDPKILIYEKIWDLCDFYMKPSIFINIC